jgi:NAD(P)-dependent dehydrogenase (short-subunit alcohol dehydrogenase family)
MAARARLRIWAKRCAPNAICPGTTATSLPETWREILGAGAPDMNRGLRMTSAERLRDIAPLRSRGTPGDVAGVAVFLASSESDYFNGQTLVVDGEWSAH